MATSPNRLQSRRYTAVINRRTMRPFSTPSSRWTAITTRDPAASSAFIYCVTSTKIYCRPTCPARLARRANVEFHENAADAEVAGYRACMRCRPGELDESAGDPQKIAVDKACELIRNEGAGGTRWSVKGLAKEVGLTESHFCRVFKKIMGSTVGEYRTRGLAKGTSRESNEKEVVPRKPSSALQVASSPFESPYSIAGIQTHDSFLDLDSELAQDWQDFSGTDNMTGAIDVFPELYTMDPSNLDFSPELVSDASTSITTDDGFQFLNFDDTASSDVYSG